MARKRDRVAAGLLACLFLFTTAGVTILVLVMQHSNSSNSTSKTMVGTKLSNYSSVSQVDNVQINDISPGKGTEITAKTKGISFHYNLALAKDGIVLSSSFDSGQPATLDIKSTVKGFAQGVVGMKVGGVRRILVPAALGYGATPPSGSNIPPNSDLVFDVTLLGAQ